MSDPGAFDNILKKMGGEKPEGKTEPAKTEKKQPSSSETVKRLRPRVSKAKTAPFSQRIDIDVLNALYDIARERDWTMNKTLRETTKAFLTKIGDRSGGGL